MEKRKIVSLNKFERNLIKLALLNYYEHITNTTAKKIIVENDEKLTKLLKKVED